MDAKSVTIDHKPVPEIGWPAMTMAFMAPSEIDMDAVKEGDSVRFAFRESAAGYELAMIAPLAETKSVSAEGRVVGVDMSAKSVTIDHEPVPEIGWPAMTMAFTASPAIDMNRVKEGETVRFAFRQTASGYELADIEPMPEDGDAGDEQ